jgi:hypothetical protein
MGKMGSHRQILVKSRYLSQISTCARINLGYITPTYTLSTHHIPDRKAFYHLGSFPRKKNISIFHRYIDDIFFTSNESLDTINQMLDEANNYHPNIKLVRQIGTSVSFLDVLIHNKNGLLVTSVYHKEATEPYIVPFKSDHPQHVFKNIIDGQLTRAARYCSTLSAFDHERRSIKLMLLYNG